MAFGAPLELWSRIWNSGLILERVQPHGHLQVLQFGNLPKRKRKLSFVTSFLRTVGGHRFSSVKAIATSRPILRNRDEASEPAIRSRTQRSSVPVLSAAFIQTVLGGPDPSADEAERAVEAKMKKRVAR